MFTLTTNTTDIDRDLDDLFDQIVASLAPLTESPQRRPQPTQAVTAPAAPDSDTTGSDVNVDLFRTALKHVTEHPETHNQMVWAQRTDNGIVGCLAYHVTRLTNHTLRWTTNCFGATHSEAGSVYPSNSTEPVHMFKAARLALGIDEEQADDLFHPYNDTDKLWELAEKYTNGRISRKEKV